MKKTLWGLIVLVCLCVGLTVTAEAATWTSEDGSYKLTYSVQSDNTVKITKYSGSSENGLTIPGEIEGLPVTVIGKNAFYLYSGAPFYGALTLPETLVTIENSAFSNCKNLTGDLVIPDSVTSIDSSAFSSCAGLTSLTLPEGLEAIASNAFYGCSGFAVLEIPSSVTSIGNYAFKNCTGLTGELLIPGNVLSIGDYAFEGCTGFSTLTLCEGVQSLGSYAFRNCCFTSDIVIPGTVTSFGSYVFYGCTGEDLIFSEGITEIKNMSGHSFSGTLTLPSTLKYLGQVGSLKGELILPEGLETIANSAFLNCTGFTGDLIIPDSVTSIGQSAFSGCSGFTGSLVVGDGVAELKDYTFRNCGFTGDLVLGSSLTTVDSYAFDGTKGFTGSLTIGYANETLRYSVGNIIKNMTGDVTVLAGDIPDGMFSEIDWTGKLTLGDGVTSIGAEAFSGCRNLTGELYFGEKLTSIGAHAFSLCDQLTGSLTLPDSLKELGEHAFSSCEGLGGTLTIGEGLAVIPKYAFSGCNFQGHLTIPDSVLVIDMYAFNSNPFSGLTLGKNVTTIGMQAFGSCGMSGDLYLPDSVVSIEGSAFYDNFDGTLRISPNLSVVQGFNGCGFTGSLVIPENATAIGDGAFSGCSGFAGKLVIPDGVTSIGRYAFNYCTGFSGSLTIPDSVTFIDDGAFDSCTGFSGSLTIGDGVTSIGYDAFYGCTGFDGFLSLSEQLTYLGSWAFRDCPFQGTLVIPGGLATIPNAAFAGHRLTTLYLTNNTTTIKSDAFIPATGADDIKTVYFTGTEEEAKEFRQECDGIDWSTWIYGSETLPTSIYISGSDTVAVGGTLQLRAKVQPSSASDKSVYWSSSDESIATVASGIVTGVSEGTVTITATSANGLTAQRIVTVRKGLRTIQVLGVTKEDPYSGTPLAGATVMIYGVTKTTDEGGMVHFTEAEMGGSTSAYVWISYDGYFDVRTTSYFMNGVTNTYTLQHKGDDIYITQIDLKVGSTDWDLLNSDRVVVLPYMDGNAVSTRAYPFTVGVDWNNYETGTIKLVGGKNGNTVTLQRGTSYAALATNFGVNEKVTLVAETVDSEGNTVRAERRLPLRLELPVELDISDGTPVDTSDIWFLKDVLMNFEAEMPNLGPVASEVSIKDDVLHVEFGYKFDEPIFDGVLLTNKLGPLGVENKPKFKLMGGVSLPLTTDAEINTWAGNIGFELGAGLDATGDPRNLSNPVWSDTINFWLGDVPCYFDMSLGIAASGSLDFGGLKDDVRVEGTLTAKGELTAGAGVGAGFKTSATRMTDNIELKLGGEGALKVEFPVTWNFMTEEPELNPSLEGIIRAKVVFKVEDIGPELKVEFGKLIWNKEGVRWESVFGSTDLLSITADDFRPVGWGYLDYGEGFVGDVVLLMSAGERTPMEVYDSINPCADATLTTIDGVPYLYFTTGDPDAQDASNNLRTYYSTWDGEAWTTPQTVTDLLAETIDSGVAADGVFVAWEDNNAAQTEDTGLTDLATMSEITVAVKGTEGYTAQTLTNDDRYDHGVEIVAGSNGTALAAWLSNEASYEEGDLTTLFSGADICYALYDGAQWGEVVTFTPDAEVTNLNATFDGTNFAIIYKDTSEDGSGELFSLPVTLESAGETSVLGTELGRYAVTEDLVAWFDAENTLTIQQEGETVHTIASTGFKGSENPVAASLGGTDYIFWLEKGGICYATNAGGSWSDSLLLMADEALLDGLACQVLDADTFMLSYLRMDYVSNGDDETMTSITDLMTLYATIGTDLRVGTISADETVYEDEGVVEYTATLFNNGEETIQSSDISFYEGDVLVYSETIREEILPGQALEVGGVFSPADGSTVHSYTVVVETADDYHSDNNEGMLTVGSLEASIQDAAFVGEQLQVVLSADGSAAVKDAVLVVRDGAEGEMVAQTDVDTIHGGDLLQVNLDLVQDKSKVYYISLELPEPDSNPANDLYLIAYADEVPELEAYLSGGAVTARVNTRKVETENAAVIVSVMDGQKMTEAVYMELTSVTALEDIQTVSCQLDSPPEDGILRVMVVEKTTLAPLCEAVTVKT